MKSRKSPDPRNTGTKRKKKPLPLKDQPLFRLLRLVFSIALAFFLLFVFIKMILPDREPVNTGRDSEAVKPDIPDINEMETESPDVMTATAPTDVEETIRAYRGEGGEPSDDPKVTWDITLELSGQTLRLLEGTVVAREFTGEPPTTDLVFSVSADRYRIELNESGTDTVLLDGAYDPVTAHLFAIKDKNHFFVLMTPKKLHIVPDLVPTRFLTKKDNSPLISMQGFIRTDDRVVGMFHSVFGPDIEYVLEPNTVP